MRKHYVDGLAVGCENGREGKVRGRTDGAGQLLFSKSFVHPGLRA